MLPQSVFIFLTCLVLLLTACEGDPRQADISGIETGIHFLSLTDSLEQSELNTDEEAIQELYQNFGTFWEAYSEDILRLGPADHPSTLLKLDDFMRFPDTEETNLAIRDVHASRMSAYTEEINTAFRRYRFFFPETALPDVVYYNSGFNYAVYPSDTHLGIGLDFFLGKEHPIVQRLDPQVFPAYLREKMDPSLLVCESLRGWLLVHHQEAHYDDQNLVSTCVYWGKMMYLLDLMLPETSDHLKMGYRPEEQRWCEQNERNLWIAFSQEQTAYETRRFEVNRWIVDGPFTRADGLPQETPARAGVWIGWQIVRDYMARNKELSPQDLLNERDYLRMMNAYRPG